MNVNRLVILTAVLSLACGSPLESERQIEPGVWGGSAMSLVVGADSAKAAFDCASGSVDLPIILDGHNRFSAAGTFRSEAGVVRPGSESPAEYAGTVTGLPGTARIMTVTITVSPTANPEFTLGPFELLEGREVTLTLCR